MPPVWMLVVLAALAFGPSTPVSADVRHTALAQDLDRAADQARELRVQLAQTTESPSIAIMQTRLQQLEELTRRLTGRLERLEFEEGKLNTRIDRLVANIDDRLRAIELQANTEPLDPLPGPTALAVPVDQSAVDGPPQPRPTAATAPAGSSEDAPEQILGTIPRDAVLGVPHPSERPTNAGPSPPVGGGSPQKRYAAALELLQTADLGSAEVAFTRFLEDHPDDEHAPEAAFWLGETYFARGDFPKAAARFARNYRAYGTDARKAPDNLLKLGMSLAKFDDTERACQSFGEFIRQFPDAPAPLRQAVERERSRAGCG